MESVNYMQVVPDSHFWTDLNQIIVSIDYYFDLMERKTHPPEPNVYYGDNEMSKEYLLIGLNNSKKNGYKIKRFGEPTGGFISPRFTSIDQIIDYVEKHNFEIGFDFHELQVHLTNTIANGLNLTNGLKMERIEIYNRINGERNYQDANWGSRRQMDGTPDEEKPVAEWINYIEFHITKAKNCVYHLDTVGATAELRKVAALAIRAMEIHGCPLRLNLNTSAPSQDIGTNCCGGDCECKKE